MSVCLSFKIGQTLTLGSKCEPEGDFSGLLKPFQAPCDLIFSRNPFIAITQKPKIWQAMQNNALVLVEALFSIHIGPIKACIIGTKIAAFERQEGPSLANFVTELIEHHTSRKIAEFGHVG